MSSKVRAHALFQNMKITTSIAAPRRSVYLAKIGLQYGRSISSRLLLSSTLVLVALPALAQHHGGAQGRGQGYSPGASHGRAQGQSHGQAQGHAQGQIQGGYRGPAPVPFLQHSAPRPAIQYAQRPVQISPAIPAPRIIAAPPPVNYYPAQARVQSYGHVPGYGSSQQQNYGTAFGTAFGGTYGAMPGPGYGQPRGYGYGHAPSYVQPYSTYSPRQVAPGWSFPNGYRLNRGYPAPGLRFPSLGPGHLALGFGGARWFFDRGVWYRPAPTGYVVAIPPYGVLTPMLPPSYATINYGGVPYYYDNGVYYTELAGQGYLVTPPPNGLPPVPSNAEGPALAQANPLSQTELQVSGLSNQSSAQYFSDRADCSRWATGQSGYDPVQNAPNDEQNMQRAQTYRDAEINCLRARSYEVR